MSIQWQTDINSHNCAPFSPLVMTMIHDQLNRPYLYIPNKEGGLPIYDIGTVTNAVLAGTIPTSQFGNLVVMNVSQDGNYRYLALGNSFTSPQA